jgi:hypothetical protein
MGFAGLAAIFLSVIAGLSHIEDARERAYVPATSIAKPQCQIIEMARTSLDRPGHDTLLREKRPLHFLKRASPTLPIGALDQQFLPGAGPKMRVESTAPARKSLVV